MLLAAGLLVFIFRGNRVIFAVLEGIVAVYGFFSAGDDLVRFLALPEGAGRRARKARAQQ